MHQVTQNYRTGRIRIARVQPPGCQAGGVLVRTAFSVISAGTEGMKVREGRMSLLGKAMARPDQVKKVLRTVRQQGVAAALEKVRSRLDALTPLGYSLSGTIVDVGAEAPEFQRGQRVACGGAEHAHHAEVVFVPKNLVVPVPQPVSLKHAAFVPIGAIALQGFRRAEMQLGETACVIGLGLIGQILVRILRTAGIGAIGVDPSPERCALARAAGAMDAASPANPSLKAVVQGLTSGHGVDCVFVAAGGSSNQPVELAAALARDRARVVEIGKTRIDLPWNDYYDKELDVRFSRSYGPGRYDSGYEQEGRDYPIGYVRWTERRNMASFLELVARGQVELDPLITAIHPFREAEAVYEAIAAGGGSGLGVLFEYPEVTEGVDRAAVVPSPPAIRRASGRIRLGVIGAGRYASTMLLPHLARDSRVELVEVATRTPLSAANAQRRFRFRRVGTDAAALLEAEDIDAVIIATRHSSHAALVGTALRSGRAVFVEKPLSIDLAGLESVREAIAATGNDRLTVGFNRRFAPLLVEMATFFSSRSYPLAMHYRVHAGQLEPRSWYLEEGEGSRFLGEGGHFLDVFAFLGSSQPVTVSATCLRPPRATADDRDNLSITVAYADGSVGSLLYLTQGGSQVPKEEIEVFGGGRTAQLHNFTRLDLFHGDARQSRKRRLDKGQKGEMRALVDAIIRGGPMPIGVDDLLDTTLATLAVDESLRTGGPVSLGDFWDAGSREQGQQSATGDEGHG